jgi:hypothetical protein
LFLQPSATTARVFVGARAQLAGAVWRLVRVLERRVDMGGEPALDGGVESHRIRDVRERRDRRLAVGAVVLPVVAAPEGDAARQRHAREQLVHVDERAQLVAHHGRYLATEAIGPADERADVLRESSRPSATRNPISVDEPAPRRGMSHARPKGGLARTIFHVARVAASSGNNCWMSPCAAV